MLHCNGMCHVQKELKAQEKKEQSTGSTSKEKHETVQFIQGRTSAALVSSVQSDHQFATYIFSSLPEVAFSVFHPPVS